MSGASDSRVAMLWRYDDKYRKAEWSFIEAKKSGDCRHMKEYEIQDVWHESQELCRAFIEWVKSQDTEQLVSELFREEEQ